MVRGHEVCDVEPLLVWRRRYVLTLAVIVLLLAAEFAWVIPAASKQQERCESAGLVYDPGNRGSLHPCTLFRHRIKKEGS